MGDRTKDELLRLRAEIAKMKSFLGVENDI